MTAYATAYPAYLSIGGQLKFSSGTASSYSGLWMYVLDEAGNIVYDQEVSKATGDLSGKFLENGAWCYGWWANNSYPADQCFWWSTNKLGGHLQDGKKYYSWIFLKARTAVGVRTGPLRHWWRRSTLRTFRAQAGICTCYAQAHRADPVNTATGMFFEQLTDAQLVGAGKQVSLERTYRSDSTTTGLLGRGWATPFDAKLTVATDKVTYQADDGAKFVFPKASDGTYTAPAGSAAKLVKGTSDFTLTTPDRTKRTFSNSGQLTSVVDAAGKGLTLTYASGKLASVKDAAGRTTTFTVGADNCCPRGACRRALRCRTATRTACSPPSPPGGQDVVVRVRREQAAVVLHRPGGRQGNQQLRHQRPHHVADRSEQQEDLVHLGWQPRVAHHRT